MNIKEKEPATVDAATSSTESNTPMKDSVDSITYKFANVKQAELVLFAAKNEITNKSECIQRLRDLNSEKYINVICRWSDDIDNLNQFVTTFEKKVHI